MQNIAIPAAGRIPGQPANPVSIRSLFRAEAGRLANSPKPHCEFRRLRGFIESLHTGAVSAFAAGGSAEAFQMARARLADDTLVGVLHTARCKTMNQVDARLLPLTAVAFGGYGRRQLAPASDLDVLFLLPESKNERLRAQNMLEFVIPALWDLGLKLDHFTMSLDEYRELTTRDTKLQSGYLDARFVWGCPALHQGFLEARRTLPERALAALARQLIVESRQRGASCHLHCAEEPNLKLGPGALRDIQCLHWLALLYPRRAVADPAALSRVAAATEFLSRVRCYLHLLTGRRDDRLTLDAQAAIAGRLQLPSVDDRFSAARLLDLVRDHTGRVRDIVTRACQEIELPAPIR